MLRRQSILKLAMIALLAAWALTGCDQSTGTDTPNDMSSRTQTINLDDPYGGFNTANEKPAFGDATLAMDYGPEGDLAVFDHSVDTTRTDRRHPQRFLLVTWGNLRADSLIDFSTDWSGSLCVENGLLRVLRTIRFEREDHLLPRTSRSCAEWVSLTQPHFDGILVSLHGQPCDSVRTTATPLDSLCEKPISVTFKTGPLTVTFTRDELVDLHKVVQVDAAGNAVAFNTIVVMPGECPHGFLAGQWIDVEGKRYAGVFRGQWVSESGLHQGYLRGVYGENSRGAHVFFGKWITQNGEFKGLLAGRYGLSPTTNTSDAADGWFKGMWFSRQLHAVGELHGVLGKGTDEKEGGFFRGAWSARCRK